MTIARKFPGRLRTGLGRMLRWWRQFGNELAVVGPEDDLARRFGHFGRGTALLAPQGAIYNEHAIEIGEDSLIGPNVCLTAGMAPGQELVSYPVVKIGDRTLIGRGSHIIGHWSIDIGDDIQTGPYVYITDQNHAYKNPDEPIGRQWPVEAAVTIGSGSWLGANVVILPGSSLGKHVVVAAGAVVRGSFPDHCVIAGVPARMVRRWTLEAGWQAVTES
ncbi:MAG: acyltransferase [Actinobacteria bacterium]|nr:acyltransferase [Actinomycetota bacterium]